MGPNTAYRQRVIEEIQKHLNFWNGVSAWYIDGVNWAIFHYQTIQNVTKLVGSDMPRCHVGGQYGNTTMIEHRTQNHITAIH